MLSASQTQYVPHVGWPQIAPVIREKSKNNTDSEKIKPQYQKDSHVKLYKVMKINQLMNKNKGILRHMA